MDGSVDTFFRDQLIGRRRRLEEVLTAGGESADVTRLLREVDAALQRLEKGTFGVCESCHDAIEPDRLVSNPLIRFCLDHLTADQQRALEQDLDLASRIQGALLPDRTLRSAGWEITYHYEGAGPVSGDYCDVVPAGGSGLFFAVGDVTGKGVAASMLMAHLHATMRTLLSLDIPLEQMVERASRAFCESTLPTHFATLACGRAGGGGEIEICNAGHPSPLLHQGGEILRVDPTGLPIGIAGDARFSARTHRLAAGDTLLLYTDGLSEARDDSGDEYGVDRIAALLRRSGAAGTQDLIAAGLADLRTFRAGAPKEDDLTVMAIRRTG